MKIAFHSNQLGILGTEVALYDYAHFNETLLKNRSIVVVPRADSRYSSPVALKKFRRRFRVFHYDSPDDLDDILAAERCDYLYAIKPGKVDAVAPRACKQLVHAVYRFCEPHGHRYAYVSEWLARAASGGTYPYVPHMVHLPNLEGDLRDALGIPRDATVIGRHGTEVGLDVEGVPEAVIRVATDRPDVRFVFVNLPNGLRNRPRPPNILALKPNVDLAFKTRFINTCDAMIHASGAGETFGLAVGEFSIRNKPVFTWAGGRGRSHLEILGDKALVYPDAEELYRMLMAFRPQPEKNWDAYTERFSPEPVMEKFREVFLDGN